MNQTIFSALTKLKALANTGKESTSVGTTLLVEVTAVLDTLLATLPRLKQAQKSTTLGIKSITSFLTPYLGSEGYNPLPEKKDLLRLAQDATSLSQHLRTMRPAERRAARWL